MNKHAFDLTSFLFGTILAVAAVGFLLAEHYTWDVDARWVLPVALILLGVAGVAGALGGLRRPRAEQDDSSDRPVDDADELRVP